MKLVFRRRVYAESSRIALVEDRRKGGVKPMLCCASVQTHRGKVAIFSDGAFLTVLVGLLDRCG